MTTTVNNFNLQTCQPCRTRKIPCLGGTPCANCHGTGLQCLPIPQQRRGPPPAPVLLLCGVNGCRKQSLPAQLGYHLLVHEKSPELLCFYGCSTVMGVHLRYTYKTYVQHLKAEHESHPGFSDIVKGASAAYVAAGKLLLDAWRGRQRQLPTSQSDLFPTLRGLPLPISARKGLSVPPSTSRGILRIAIPVERFGPSETGWPPSLCVDRVFRLFFDCLSQVVDYAAHNSEIPFITLDYSRLQFWAALRVIGEALAGQLNVEMHTDKPFVWETVLAQQSHDHILHLVWKVHHLYWGEWEAYCRWLRPADHLAAAPPIANQLVATMRAIVQKAHRDILQKEGEAALGHQMQAMQLTTHSPSSHQRA